MGRKITRTFVTVIVVFILVSVAWNSFTVTTYKNQYNVIKTMGRIVRVETEPGLSFKIPIIQSKDSILKSKLLYDIAPTEIYTSDKKKMQVDAYIVWSVADPTKYTQTLNASRTGAESKISAMVYGALKATVSSTSQEELIASRDSALDKMSEDDALSDVDIQDITSEQLQDETGGTPAQEGTPETGSAPKVIPLSDRILEKLGKDYDPEQYGITVHAVKIKMLDLPDENKDAVYNRMITERKNIAAAYKAQGESEAQKIRNMTDKETQIMLSEASAKAAQLEAEGEAEYMNILSDAYNDEEKADYYLFVRQLDAAKKSLTGGNTTLFLDSDSPIASLFTQEN